jgi:hypothetical protein
MELLEMKTTREITIQILENEEITLGGTITNDHSFC